MTPEEENKLREIIKSYKTQPLRGSSIEGYSLYAMEDAVIKVYLLGKAQKEKELINSINN